MKKSILLLASIFCITVIYASTIDQVIVHFSNGNAEGLAQYLNANVELVIKNADNVFTRQQTETILDDFFKKNQPQKLTIKEQGKRDNQQFVIGTLQTKKGNYRVYFLLKNELIQQLRIENSND